jgi:hypothetical protein
MIRLADILTEAGIEDYPAYYQKWYNSYLNSAGGKAKADAYLKSLPPAKELKKKEELGKKIEAKLKEIHRKAYDEHMKKKMGSQAYPQLLFKYYKEELPKFGKITDKQIVNMMRKDSIKTIWDEVDYLVKIFIK